VMTYKTGKHFAQGVRPRYSHLHPGCCVLISLYDKDDNARTNLLPSTWPRVRFLAVACLRRCVTLGGGSARHTNPVALGAALQAICSRRDTFIHQNEGS
jgi:hypothetical protein